MALPDSAPPLYRRPLRTRSVWEQSLVQTPQVHPLARLLLPAQSRSHRQRHRHSQLLHLAVLDVLHSQVNFQPDQSPVMHHPPPILPYCDTCLSYLLPVQTLSEVNRLRSY